MLQTTLTIAKELSFNVDGHTAKREPQHSLEARSQTTTASEQTYFLSDQFIGSPKAEVVVPNSTASEKPTLAVLIIPRGTFFDRGLAREHNPPQPFRFDVGNKEQFPDLGVPVLSEWTFQKYLIGGILPLKLRENIWEHAMRGGLYHADSRHFSYYRALVDPVQMRNNHANRINYPRFLLPVRFITNAIKTEITRVFIRNSTFIVSSLLANGYLQAYFGTSVSIIHV